MCVVVLAHECDPPAMAKANLPQHQQWRALGAPMLPGVEAELAVCTVPPSAPALRSLMPVC